MLHETASAPPLGVGDVEDTPQRSTARKLLNRVPAVTIFFWIIREGRSLSRRRLPAAPSANR